MENRKGPSTAGSYGMGHSDLGSYAISHMYYIYEKNQVKLSFKHIKHFFLRHFKKQNPQPSFQLGFYSPVFK